MSCRHAAAAVAEIQRYTSKQSFGHRDTEPQRLLDTRRSALFTPSDGSVHPERLHGSRGRPALQAGIDVEWRGNPKPSGSGTALYSRADSTVVRRSAAPTRTMEPPPCLGVSVANFFICPSVHDCRDFTRLERFQK